MVGPQIVNDLAAETTKDVEFFLGSDGTERMFQRLLQRCHRFGRRSRKPV